MSILIQGIRRTDIMQVIYCEFLASFFFYYYYYFFCKFIKFHLDKQEMSLIWPFYDALCSPLSRLSIPVLINKERSQRRVDSLMFTLFPKMCMCVSMLAGGWG